MSTSSKRFPVEALKPVGTEGADVELTLTSYPVKVRVTLPCAEDAWMDIIHMDFEQWITEEQIAQLDAKPRTVSFTAKQARSVIRLADALVPMIVRAGELLADDGWLIGRDPEEPAGTCGTRVFARDGMVVLEDDDFENHRQGAVFADVTAWPALRDTLLQAIGAAEAQASAS